MEGLYYTQVRNVPSRYLSSAFLWLVMNGLDHLHPLFTRLTKVYRHGAQGILDGASNQQLDSEFGTHKEEDVVAQILEKGNVQETTSDARQGERVSGFLLSHP